MDFVNTVILEGTISDYPEIHYFGYEHIQMKFKLHTIEKGLKANGDGWEQWHSIELVNQLAKQAENELKIGDKVRVEGRLAYHKNFDNEGEKHYITVIHARAFVLLNQAEEKIKESEEERAEAFEELNWRSFKVDNNEDPMA